jgi:membrane protein YdbS with pleckstrin-like domain
MSSVKIHEMVAAMISEALETFDQVVDFVRKSLHKHIASFYKRRIRNKRVAFFIKMSVVLLGAVATVLLGIKQYAGQPCDSTLSIAAMIVTALIPVLSAWEAFFEHRWLWIRFAKTLGLLYGISDAPEYAIA